MMVTIPTSGVPKVPLSTLYLLSTYHGGTTKFRTSPRGHVGWGVIWWPCKTPLRSEQRTVPSCARYAGVPVPRSAAAHLCEVVRDRGGVRGHGFRVAREDLVQTALVQSARVDRWQAGHGGRAPPLPGARACEARGAPTGGTLSPRRAKSWSDRHAFAIVGRFPSSQRSSSAHKNFIER